MDTGDLARQVRELRVPEGHLAVWALGQQGYLLKGGDHTLVIDPYLSNYVEEIAPDPEGGTARIAPIPVLPEELDTVSLALITHAHADHCDPKTLRPLLGASPGVRVLTSYRARDELLSMGFSPARIEVPRVGERTSYGNGLYVTTVPSAHYSQEPDAQGNPAYLGFLVRLNGVTLYHCGDSIVYPGLVEQLRAYSIDLACLPINGRDWFREQSGLVGNMDYREAAELAAAVGVKVLLPGHNDMFRANRINPAYLLDYLQAHYPRQRVHFLQSGELYYYAG